MNIIRQIMKDKKISQEELSQVTGIPQSSISYMLRQLDKGVINLGNSRRVETVCKVLKIRLKDLLSNDNKINPKNSKKHLQNLAKFGKLKTPNGKQDNNSP
jgi:DNA-binding Xre family transcriptional regulator